MEEKSKQSCSCRIAVNDETGRVQWCVGKLHVWTNVLKWLVFVPVVLLTAALITYIVSRVAVTAATPQTTRLKPEDIWYINEEKRNIQRGLQTVYVPEYDDVSLPVPTAYYNDNDLISVNHSKQRQRRSPTFNTEDYVVIENYETVINNESATTSRNKREKYDTSMNSTELHDDESQEHVIAYNISTKELWQIATTKTEKPDLKPFFHKHKISKEEIRSLQSKFMRTVMNSTVNPCTDFYEYACGNWNKHFQIPPDRASYDTFGIVRDNLDFVIKDLLDDVHPPPASKNSEEMFKSGYILKSIFEDLQHHDHSKAVVKARNFYLSCMNEEMINKRGDEPLKKILKQLGGWPIVDKDWDGSNFDLVSLLAKLRLLNNDILISEWIGPDMKNSKEYMIHIDQTSLGLSSRDFYIEPSTYYSKVLAAYRRFIHDIAHIMGATNIALGDIDELLKFETELARIVSLNADRRSVSDVYLRTDIQSLSLHFPDFDWDKYFLLILGRKISSVYPVAIHCVEYLQKMLELIKNTHPRILQNYILWRFIRHRTNNLDARYSIAKQKFYHVLIGREREPPRWTFCVAQVNAKMDMAVGALFVRKYFDVTSKNDTTAIIELLQEAFRNTLFENNWLDNYTRDYARIKINEMDLKIGFPDFILNEKELNEKYSDIHIHPDYFFENTLSILRHVTRTEKLRIGNSVDKKIWSISPAVVNAYYSRNKNQILFPAGMLQPPFYHKHFPKALNFGGTGVVIGHEITHGFDDKGRLFDHHGNFHLWWKEASIEKFNEKAQCLINQYSKYVIPDIKIPIDGFLTQGENIADNGGLKQAFLAYKSWLDQNPDNDESLPHMPHNGEQLFFLSFAQVWCGRQRSEVAKTRISTSVHAPGMFRVIGAISNSEDFAKAFNCPLNSPMNPQDKCTIW